jgi:uncharacterized protein YeaC (DUF1315 family)
MVAVIHQGRSLRAVLNYNENKVQQQVATCIDAGNYPLDANDLTYNQKLLRLQKLTELNTRSQVKTLHISLNFHPSEVLSGEKMQEIRAEYMQRIGFGDQPYLVYRHFDSGHPHCHVITTNIKPDGKAIPLHNLGKIQSEKARKEIQIKYGLLKAEDHTDKLSQIKPVNTSKVKYGKSDTRRAIYNVLAGVLKSYKYTSLHELNALLKLYNVAAETGQSVSRIHTHGGLLYRVLDSEGNAVGVPIKASLFPDTPGLKFLQNRYSVNDALRQPYKARMKNSIDFALIHGHRTSLEEMIKQLRTKNIDTVIRRNDDGRIYGLTFIDHEQKCVWNGSDLGKQYGAKGILERCKPLADEGQTTHQPLQPKPDSRENTPQKDAATAAALVVLASNSGDTDQQKGMLEELMQAEYNTANLPYQLRKRRKKKRRNQSNNL